MKSFDGGAYVVIYIYIYIYIYTYIYTVLKIYNNIVQPPFFKLAGTMRNVQIIQSLELKVTTNLPTYV